MKKIFTIHQACSCYSRGLEKSMWTKACLKPSECDPSKPFLATLYSIGSYPIIKFLIASLFCTQPVKDQGFTAL